MIDNAKEIQIINHSKGVFKGMGWGFLSGFLIGGIVGATSSEDEETKITGSEESISYLVGGLTGLLLGGIYGGISGVTDYYVFVTPSMEVDESQKKK